MNLEQLKAELATGESLHVEFKEWPVRANDLAAALVAFANTDGGRLFLGVRDKDHTVVGVADVDVVTRQVDNVAYNNCDPPITVVQETVTTPKGAVVMVNIPRGDARPYRTNSGIYYIRTSSGRRQASRQELLRLFQSTDSFYYDETPVYQAETEELDKRAIARFFQETQGDTWESMGLDYERVLLNLKLARPVNGTLRPTVAGLLFFARNGQQFIPQAYISAAAFPGASLEKAPFDQKRIVGNMQIMLEDALRFLYIHLRVAHKIEGLEPEAYPELPAIAIRELLVNALAHRDYTIAGPIRILVFDNRVDIRTPGGLPNGVTVEALPLGIHVLRNPIIYNLFLRRGLVTDVGSGFPRIIAQVRQTTGRDPVWKLEGNDFVVSLPRQTRA